MAKIIGLKVERTGNTFSIASSEFLATYPDGTQDTFWSPPWHDWGKKEEEQRAYKKAMEFWQERNK